MEHDLFDYVFLGIFLLPILTTCIWLGWFTWRLFKE